MPDLPSEAASAPAPAPSAAPEASVPRLRLDLDDPAEVRATDDRPEAWGDETSDDRTRLAEYRRNTPPHHG